MFSNSNTLNIAIMFQFISKINWWKFYIETRDKFLLFRLLVSKMVNISSTYLIHILEIILCFNFRNVSWTDLPRREIMGSFSLFIRKKKFRLKLSVVSTFQGEKEESKFIWVPYTNYTEGFQNVFEGLGLSVVYKTMKTLQKLLLMWCNLRVLLLRSCNLKVTMLLVDI